MTLVFHLFLRAESTLIIAKRLHVNDFIPQLVYSFNIKLTYSFINILIILNH